MGVATPPPCDGFHCIAEDCYDARQPGLAYCAAHGEMVLPYWANLGRFAAQHPTMAPLPIPPTHEDRTAYHRAWTGVGGGRCEGAILGYRWLLRTGGGIANQYEPHPIRANGVVGAPLWQGEWYSLMLPEGTAAARHAHWERLLAAINAADGPTASGTHEWRRAPATADRWNCRRCGAALLHAQGQTPDGCPSDRALYTRQAGDLAP